MEGHERDNRSGIPGKIIAREFLPLADSFYISSIKPNAMKELSYYTQSIEYPVKPKRPVLKANPTPTEVRAYAAELEKHNDDLEAYGKRKEEYYFHTQRLQHEFQIDAIREVGLEGHEAEGRAWDMAWDSGHAYGLGEVFTHLQTIAYVITGK